MKVCAVGFPGFAFLVASVMALPAAHGETAEQNFRLYCAQCHGTLGNGQGINETSGGLNVSPRDHTSASEMSKLTDQELRLAITEGGDAVQKSGLMPAWGSTLSSEQIDQLVSYLRKLCNCQGRR